MGKKCLTIIGTEGYSFAVVVDEHPENTGTLNLLSHFYAHGSPPRREETVSAWREIRLRIETDFAVSGIKRWDKLSAAIATSFVGCGGQALVGGTNTSQSRLR